MVVSVNSIRVWKGIQIHPWFYFPCSDFVDESYSEWNGPRSLLLGRVRGGSVAALLSEQLALCYLCMSYLLWREKARLGLLLKSLLRHTQQFMRLGAQHKPQQELTWASEDESFAESIVLQGEAWNEPYSQRRKFIRIALKKKERLVGEK